MSNIYYSRLARVLRGALFLLVTGFSATTVAQLVFLGEGPAGLPLPFGLLSFTPLTGGWVIDDENTGGPGRGMQIEVQNNVLVLSFYGFDESGAAQWWIAAGGLESGSNELTMELQEFENGKIFGGPTDSAVASGVAGQVTLRFSDFNKGEICLPDESCKSISAFNFGFSDSASALLGAWAVSGALFDSPISLPDPADIFDSPISLPDPADIVDGSISPADLLGLLDGPISPSDLLDLLDSPDINIPGDFNIPDNLKITDVMYTFNFDEVLDSIEPETIDIAAGEAATSRDGEPDFGTIECALVDLATSVNGAFYRCSLNSLGEQLELELTLIKNAFTATILDPETSGLLGGMIGFRTTAADGRRLLP